MHSPTSYSGLLFIGDPHLCGRTPGFRCDDYPAASINKLRWTLEYAREHRLLPCLLGDLFHYPRDNTNGMLVQLMEILDGSALAIAGNHDCAENTLHDNDTLSVLFAAGRLRRLGDTEEEMWHGTIGSHAVALGGSCWGSPLPRQVSFTKKQPRWVMWMTHHDLRFAGCEESSRLQCAEIDGVDLVVNGHIHRQLDDVVAGRTTWCNPGNIMRVNRSDIVRSHRPGVLRVDVRDEGLKRTRIDVPCEDFEKVFHPQATSAAPEAGAGPFVNALQMLQRHKTDDGQGLMAFLDAT